MNYLWHGQEAALLAKAPFRRGIKRNALIRLVARDVLLVVPWRALRRKEYALRCPWCGGTPIPVPDDTELVECPSCRHRTDWYEAFKQGKKP